MIDSTDIADKLVWMIKRFEFLTKVEKRDRDEAEKIVLEEIKHEPWKHGYKPYEHVT